MAASEVIVSIAATSDRVRERGVDVAVERLLEIGADKIHAPQTDVVSLQLARRGMLGALTPSGESARAAVSFFRNLKDNYRDPMSTLGTDLLKPTDERAIMRMRPLYETDDGVDFTKFPLLVGPDQTGFLLASFWRAHYPEYEEGPKAHQPSRLVIPSNDIVKELDGFKAGLPRQEAVAYLRRGSDWVNKLNIQAARSAFNFNYAIDLANMPSPEELSRLAGSERIKAMIISEAAMMDMKPDELAEQTSTIKAVTPNMSKTIVETEHSLDERRLGEVILAIRSVLDNTDGKPANTLDSASGLSL